MILKPTPLVEVALHLFLQLPLNKGAVGADLKPEAKHDFIIIK